MEGLTTDLMPSYMEDYPNVSVKTHTTIPIPIPSKLMYLRSGTLANVYAGELTIIDLSCSASGDLTDRCNTEIEGRRTENNRIVHKLQDT